MMYMYDVHVHVQIEPLHLQISTFEHYSAICIITQKKTRYLGGVLVHLTERQMYQVH